MELKRKYYEAKKKTSYFMRNGDIASYMKSLVEMNEFKKELKQVYLA